MQKFFLTFLLMFCVVSNVFATLDANLSCKAKGLVKDKHNNKIELIYALSRDVLLGGVDHDEILYNNLMYFSMTITRRVNGQNTALFKNKAMIDLSDLGFKLSNSRILYLEGSARGIFVSLGKNLNFTVLHLLQTPDFKVDHLLLQGKCSLTTE